MLAFRFFLNEGSIQLAQRLASIAVAVIQAIGRLEFEDGLRTGVLQEDCWCPCGIRTKNMVTAKHPFGVRHDLEGGVDGDLCPLSKPNSNRRVPHSKVLTLVHLVGMLWCKERHLGLAKGNSYVSPWGLTQFPRSEPVLTVMSRQLQTNKHNY